jgi:triacylglycerol lipase
MGVTLARKAIKGGSASDDLAGGVYNLGAPLSAKVNVFIGIAGANEGLVDCYSSPELPTCGYTNGILCYLNIFFF